MWQKLPSCSRERQYLSRSSAKHNDSSHQKTEGVATSAPGKGTSNGRSRPLDALLRLLRQHIWKLELIQGRYDTQIREALPPWWKPMRTVHLHHCWDRQWPVGQRRMWNWEPHSLGLEWWRVQDNLENSTVSGSPLQWSSTPRKCMWLKVTREFLTRLFHNASTMQSPTLWLKAVLFESPVDRKSATCGVRDQRTVSCWIFNRFSSLLVCLEISFTCWDTRYAWWKKSKYFIITGIVLL